MRNVPVLGSFSANGLIRSRSVVSMAGSWCFLTVADNSLRVLSICRGDLLVCLSRPFYEDGCLVLCRTVGTQSDPLSYNVAADSRYYVGRYRQISDLVTVVLPCGRILAGDVLVLYAVSRVLRLFE